MATLDLRCDNTLHGRLTDNRWLEVKCKRRACGFVKGTVVLHTIDLHTGEVVKTDRYAEPRNNSRKDAGHDPAPRSTVRSA